MDAIPKCKVIAHKSFGKLSLTLHLTTGTFGPILSYIFKVTFSVAVAIMIYTGIKLFQQFKQRKINENFRSFLFIEFEIFCQNKLR